MRALFYSTPARVLSALLLLLAAWTISGADQPADALTDGTPVAQVLHELGEDWPAHLPDTSLAGVSVERGRRIVQLGLTDDGRQSKHFVCTSCHNIEREDPDLRFADPEARLGYVADRGLPFLPGTTLYGVVNRVTFYNGDYEKKYGDLVRPARRDLRGAIQLCATECAQGEALSPADMESVVAYLWTIDLKTGDLALSDSERQQLERALAGRGDAAAARQLVKDHYLDHAPATFVTPPADRKAGYAEEGRPGQGRLIYEQSCLHCHEQQRYSFFNLDDSKYSFEFLEKHFDRYTRYSTYQVVRYGTSPIPGKRAYMPHYPLEKMSNQQVEDLRAYVRERAAAAQ